MNKGDLIDKIAKDTGLTKVQSAAALDATLKGVQSGLKKEKDRVTLVGFGTFTVSVMPQQALTYYQYKTTPSIKFKINIYSY